MHKLLLCSASFLFLSLSHLCAQSINYLSCNVGAGMFFNMRATNDQLQVTFPYTVTDASGSSTQHTFTSHAITPYGRQTTTAAAASLEAGNEKKFFILGMGIIGTEMQFSLGYGRNYYFMLPFIHPRDAYKSALVFKPSLGLSYNHFGGSHKNKTNYLGTIDNDGVTVHALGKTSGPQFTYTDDEDNTQTEDTKTLDFYLAQNVVALTPRLAIGSNQFKHWWHWEAAVAYYVPLYERMGISVEQNGTNEINGAAVPLRRTATATFGGRNISSAPNRFSGFFVSVTAGFCLSDRKSSRQQEDEAE